MNHRTIELLLIQLEENFSRSRGNIYSDSKKEKHFIELHKLFESIKSSNYRDSFIPELNNFKLVIEYIFKGLEYLDNSTLNIIPFEIVTCLENALKDWIEDEKFIIVTTMSNRINEYYFESEFNEEKFVILNSFIKLHFNCEITHRLIKICLPKIHSKDYLSMVVLYHELGHFVDFELNITKKLFFSKYLKANFESESEEIELCHTSEYFADLFAAQYIDNASNLYLNYIAYGQPDSKTHPSTEKRIDVVNKFLNGENCSELTQLNSVLQKSQSTLIIKKRFVKIEIDESDFLSLVPQSVNSIDELHYVFKLGWEFWNDSDNNLLKNFNSRDKYHAINNLIEKSISNFKIKQIWHGIS